MQNNEPPAGDPPAGDPPFLPSNFLLPGLQTPPNLESLNPKEWKAWKQQWQNYSIVANLEERKGTACTQELNTYAERQITSVSKCNQK